MAAANRDPRNALRGRLRNEEPLARHTAWGIGGPAERFYEPADLADLCQFLSTLDPREPLFWLGFGSNLLVRDGGLRGTVIHTAGCLGELVRIGPGRVRAEAGVPCPKVAKFCAREGLGGAEFLAGIPGTVGGALAMNAGAFDGETYDVVARVHSVTRRGELRAREASEYRAGYRHVEAPAGEWFVAAELSLRPTRRADAEALIRELLRRRGASQPTGQRSCGSVFRNPPGDFAARLIERCGLKGERVGDAVVSEKHANFILNVGHAQARDVETLIGRIAARVEQQHGVKLVPEVRVVGEPA